MNNNPKLTTIVLASNETFSLEQVVDEISSLKFVEKIIIISPNFVSNECLSTQKKILSKYLNVESFIQPEEFPGYGGAVKYGLKYVNTKYFSWLDGDGETDPSYLKDMYKILLKNEDINIVNASRFKNNNIFIKNYGFFSSIFTCCFQILCKLFFDRKITDYTVGYRIYKTDIFKKFNFSSNDQNFSLETILLPLLSEGIKVSEIYYQWIKRSDGNSHNNLLNKMSYFKIFFKILYMKISNKKLKL